MNKLFTVAGTAVSPEGRARFCVATGTVARRAYKLGFHGCTEVQLMALPQPMTRADAEVFVRAHRAAEAATQAAAADPVAAAKRAFVERMAAARAAKKLRDAADAAVRNNASRDAGMGVLLHAFTS